MQTNMKVFVLGIVSLVKTKYTQAVPTNQREKLLILAEHGRGYKYTVTSRSYDTAL